jgi:hypothetical protein
VFEVSVELATLPELRPSTWTAGPGDVRQLTAAVVFDSYSQSLFQELLAPGKADYAIIDLGAGREWLTSRLFIFALVLGEVRGLRAFVFLETTPSTRRKFLGVATPENVRRMLGLRYPWFEEALARALNGTYGVDLQNPIAGQSAFSSQPSPLNGAGSVPFLVRQFIDKLHRTTAPPEDERESYLAVATTPAGSAPPSDWERARWISADELERDLSSALEYEWVEESADTPRAAVLEAVVRRPVAFVALVDGDRRFRGLVDRFTLLGQMAAKEGLGKRSESDAS